MFHLFIFSFPCSNYLAETGTKYMKRNMGNYMLMYLSCVIVKYVRYVSFKFFTYIYIYGLEIAFIYTHFFHSCRIYQDVFNISTRNRIWFLVLTNFNHFSLVDTKMLLKSLTRNLEALGQLVGSQ